NLLDAIRSDKQSNLSASLQMIEKAGKGALIFMQHEEKQIGLTEKLKAYNGNLIKPSDSKDYGIGAQIIRALGISRLKLISNNPQTNLGVIHAYGLEVDSVVPFKID